MTSTGPLLERCAARLKPFERMRMGRLGCLASWSGMAAAVLAIAMGWWDTAGSWGAGFRFTVVCGLAAVLIFFLVAAALEQIRERAVWREVAAFLHDSGMEIDALRQAAEIRAPRLTGGTRLAALLRDPPGGGRSPSA